MKKATVVGLGLMGGSIAMALAQGHIIENVVGVDNNPRTLSLALNTRSVHQVSDNLAEGIRDSDMVILATPVGTMPSLAQKMLPHLKPGCLVTDVGSTKEHLVQQLEAIFHPKVNYIGGHPMTGSEKGGIQAADRYLFENAVYLLTPTAISNTEALESLKALLKAIGARVLVMPPAQHDNIVAAVSHLPHIVASALVNIAGKDPKILQFAAGGFRDTTRIASGNPALWRDILVHNSSSVLAALDEFEYQLAIFRRCLEQKNFEDLEYHLENAGKLREQIPQKQKGFLPSLHEVVVTIPDRPGMIGEMAILLGKEDINIIDIEILRVREGDGGTIRLGFQTIEAARKAVDILWSKGIVAKER